MGRKTLPTDAMNLTERERRMLDFLTKSAIEKGYPPTVREICGELGVKSTSTVHKDLASLESKGFIKRDPAKPRAIEINGLDRRNAQTPPDYHSFSTTIEREDIVDIPLIGQVAAGKPILAEENIMDSFPIPARYIGNNGSVHFMLTIKGESMIEVGIFDGDYILVRQETTAENGDIVVAMIDGFESEATVKTFYKENDHIRLQPENSSMSPIIVRDVKILGIVKGVFRYFN